MIDPDELSVEEVSAGIVEATAGGRQFEVIISRWTKNLADRGGHVQLGYPSPTAYLAHQTRMSAGHAQQVVSRGMAAERAPVVLQAWADGWLSTDQTRHLLKLTETVPDVFPDAEERLVDVVEGLSVADTARTVEYRRQSVDGPGEVAVETQLQRRGVSLSETIGGRRRVDGRLTSLAGQALETALDALMIPPGEDDPRTPRQRRHDALEDLARDWLDHADTPTVAGEKPHLIVLTDIPGLEGHAGGTHQTLPRRRHRRRRHP
ncbi:MAG TPA: DUF222 domain-containing protein, partial [Acidimicrobiia bacterium]|nr:DUF222 domain-containing protein [Acidimicrobiia bacterium]